jgi:hypothetical protein
VTTDTTDVVAAERERISRILTLPLLAALRCIPDGRIQNGCVISDGAKVRENARQAYLAVRDGLGQPPVHQELVDTVLRGVRNQEIHRRSALPLLEIAGLTPAEAYDAAHTAEENR